MVKKRPKKSWEWYKKKHGTWSAVATSLGVSVSWLREIRKGRTTGLGTKTKKVSKKVTGRLRVRRPKELAKKERRLKRLEKKVSTLPKRSEIKRRARKEAKEIKEELKKYKQTYEIQKTVSPKGVRVWEQVGEVDRKALERAYRGLIKGKVKIKDKKKRLAFEKRYIENRNKTMRHRIRTKVELYDKKNEIAATISVEGLLIEESFEFPLEFEGKPIGSGGEGVFQEFKDKMARKYGIKNVTWKRQKEGKEIICRSVKIRHDFS